MIYNSQDTINKSLPMLISSHAISTAKEFARQQPNRQKAEEVFLNTIAVLVVKDYLKWLNIPTRLEFSDSWNPITRLSGNVADLVLTGLGRLECRFVRQNQDSCFIPLESHLDRVGYIIVQIADNLQSAKILGFTAKVSQEYLPIIQLQPLEDLFNHLHQLQTLTNLSQWFQGILSNGWQSVESIWGNDPQMAYSFRSFSPLDKADINSAKLIDLGIKLGNQNVVLLVALTQTPEQKVNVRIQLHPPMGETYLPANIRLMLISESGDILEEVRSRIADNFIQLPLITGNQGEQFQIQIALNDAIITESFLI
ncbi:MAG: DUF1822 family protein [Crinalium sp.]